MQRHAWADAGVNHQMRAQIDHERKRIQVWQGMLFLFLQLLVRRLLRILQLELLAVPTPAQRQIMIADNCRKLPVLYKAIEYFPALWSFRNQVTDGDETVFGTEFDFDQHVFQLVVAAMNVPNDDRSRCHYLLYLLI